MCLNIFWKTSVGFSQKHFTSISETRFYKGIRVKFCHACWACCIFLLLKGVISLQIIQFLLTLGFFSWIFFKLIFFKLVQYLFIKIYVQNIHCLALRVTGNLIWAHLSMSWRSSGLKEILTDWNGKNICTSNTFLRCLENLSKAWAHSITYTKLSGDVFRQKYI